MTAQRELAELFLSLHEPGRPLIMPNAWDEGSAKLFESIGFRALATTSSGFAATRGRLDGDISRDEAVDHTAAMSAATDLPVSADLENGFADDPEGVARTIELAIGTGAAGGSIEDSTRDADTPIYEFDLAVARVAAAATAAHSGDASFVLTARAENHLYGRVDLDDTIARLKAFEDAGADVVFAPGWIEPDDVKRIVDAVTVPVSVLVRPGGPTVGELASVGVARISTGGALGFLALGAAGDAARELLEHGTVGFLDRARSGARQARDAFRGSG
jgi:2-methylisocitrate lyase-like PEP mutase family enzyme